MGFEIKPPPFDGVLPASRTELDRQVMKATTLWAVAIVRSTRREKWRENNVDQQGTNVLNIWQGQEIDEIVWFLDEAEADARIETLRKARDRGEGVARKYEMRFGRVLQAKEAHQLCEAMTMAWATRAQQTKGIE